MTQGSDVDARRARLAREAVLSATPARLVTMLYDRLLLDLHRAEEAQRSQNWRVASENLVHAQAIVTELMSSLDLAAWDGAPPLFSLYGYVFDLLVRANLEREPAATREGIDLLEPLRQSWHEAASGVASGAVAPTSMGTLGVA